VLVERCGRRLLSLHYASSHRHVHATTQAETGPNRILWVIFTGDVAMTCHYCCGSLAFRRVDLMEEACGVQRMDRTLMETRLVLLSPMA